MNHYRVVIFDENQKVLISKVVTAFSGDDKEYIAGRAHEIIAKNGAPFAVTVSDYIPDSMTAYDFIDYLNTALNEMSLKGTE